MKINKILFIVALFFGLNFMAFAQDSFQHIRNATAKISYAGKVFLLDPYLAPKGKYPGFEGTLNSHLRNPLIELPMDVKEVYKGVDAIIITHTHPDHFDEVAAQILPKELPVFVQHNADAKLLVSQGFKNIKVIYDSVEFDGVKLSKTGGAHGTVEMYANPNLSALLGDAMGVVFETKGHETLYVMGDTLWTADVNKALNKFNPSVVVMNTGDARILGFENSGIIMGKADVEHAAKVLVNTKIIAVHMDAVNHASVSREDLRKFVKEKGIDSKIIIPNDGDVVKF
ncbi:MBL fold metallo-hydrolase [Campylobacter sp. RM9344]|uniref:MBL fold metallo-hydrolase n=1 Tax=Campylobacter californiensis TaxID=1032243 RepID=A0AAW3ZWT7_9BACT|nr:MULTISPECIES: MBL fold metallo-hydrolase [unclassified Campylobacter]MBE2983896.1 MBL fold metallo-hydrolase [Campylobacter sp. RM6883]MBE2986058.1 MBL fold metallo-hydrolase [Campylobacter sp. RM12919]MBE2987471.1 MBL fold metallo-hydrolase [Campylobacter sp. RM12920]MBE2994434.1 MBL fold metallo-hydrolase [Campylobacter sp. RM6913]MBE3028742.1 MBL fold metallo-hydrolase [Campylobacter sp. RM9344]